MFVLVLMFSCIIGWSVVHLFVLRTSQKWVAKPGAGATELAAKKRVFQRRLLIFDGITMLVLALLFAYTRMQKRKDADSQRLMEEDSRARIANLVARRRANILALNGPCDGGNDGPAVIRDSP